jgi:ankyrin
MLAPVRCPNCGSSDIDENLACRFCGSPLKVQKDNLVMLCRRCGELASEKDSFCGRCGGSLTLGCPYCKEDHPKGIEFCPKTGKSMRILDYFNAIRCGDLGTVMELTELNRSFANTRDFNGNPPLMWAVMGNFREIADYLIEKGAYVNCKSNSWGSALHVASREGNLPMVEFLLSKGAGVNSFHKTARDGLATPLHHAVAKEHASIANLLVERGANVNIVAEYGLGISALGIAVNRGNKAIAECLLKSKADPDGKSSSCPSPLHCTARLGNMEIAVLLLDYGATIDLPDATGSTPLHIAVLEHQVAMVKLLLERGAAFNIRNRLGKTPFEIASERRFADLMKIMLSRRQRVNELNDDGYSLIHYAVIDGDVDMVKWLAANGADLNLESDDECGYAPIHLAVVKGDRTIFEVLRALGADLGLRDRIGRTLAEIAAEENATMGDLI